MNILNSEKFAFLKSTRFWAMVFGILAAYLSGDLTSVQAVQAFFAGFLAVGTFDRAAEKIGAVK